MAKTEYEKLILEIIEFDNEDVITESINLDEYEGDVAQNQ